MCIGDVSQIVRVPHLSSQLGFGAQACWDQKVVFLSVFFNTDLQLLQQACDSGDSGCMPLTNIHCSFPNIFDPPDAQATDSQLAMCEAMRFHGDS